MRNTMVLLGALLIGLSVNLVNVPDANAKRLRGKYANDARQIFKGNRAIGDLAKWEGRLKEEEKKWSKNPINIAHCHTAIGILSTFKGNYQKAMEHLTEALKITRKHGLERIEMQAVHWMGIAQLKQGNLDDALTNFEEGLQVAQMQNFRRLVTRNLVEINKILLMMGRYQESMERINRLMQIAGNIKDEKLIMTFQNGLGLIYAKQGDTQKAREHFEKSLKLSRDLDKDKWTAANLNGLGETWFQEGENAKALEYYKQARAIFKNKQHKVGLAITMNLMGQAHLRMGSNEKALKLFRKSRERALEKGMKAHIAVTSQNIGKVYYTIEKWDEAQEWLNEAITLFGEIQIPDALRDCYETKGIILEKMGDVNGAEKNYRESVKLLEALRQDIAGGEQEALKFLESRGNAYHRLISLLLKQGKTTEALKFLERSQLKKLRDQFDQINPELASEEEEKAKEKEKKLREQIEATRVQLAEEQSKPEEEKDKERIAQLEETLSVKKQQYIEYVNDLREKFPELASLLSIQPDTLIDLQNLLPPQVALVQYLILDERLYIFVVTKETLAYKEVALKKSELEGKIDYLRSLLMNPQIPLNVGPLESHTLRPTDEGRSDAFEMFIGPFLQASEALYQVLIEPVEGELSKYQILGIIPNGKLHLLPFQTLGKLGSEDKFQFLLEEKSIFHLNSQSILKFAQKRAKPIGNEGKLIAFGNPDESLKHAEEEVRLIKDLFKKSKTYVKNEASEERVKKGLKGFNILHLATHGKMKGNIKESHILLAGTADGKEDGQLFLKEVWGLPLEGYQLVTLSACETAKGQEASGDVMVSLQTAFLRAGTPTILASLWEVDDQATGVLMKAFYENLMNQGKAEALRTAQLSLMKDPKYVYPYYWAPFILAGDWR